MSTPDSQSQFVHACGSRRQRVAPAAVARHHRIDEVLEAEGVSLRCVAQRMDVPMPQARDEANPQRDLPLSALYRWQQALRVPIADLLAPPSDRLSPVIGLRAGLVKAMRTLRSIQLEVDDQKVQTLAISLADQLLGMMPELKDVPAWPSLGAQRTGDELGAIAYRQVSDELFEVQDR